MRNLGRGLEGVMVGVASDFTFSRVLAIVTYFYSSYLLDLEPVFSREVLSYKR